ncbi:MAG: RtcB family protein [Dehalococcoidia bacterium]|nr:RtcB family protein [Dehalococcoidia bacterium]
MTQDWGKVLRKLDANRWEIPKSYKPGMRVPGIVYASEKMIESVMAGRALEQVANVAFLPGIVKASLAMPDIHWGYGFAIGGVAATRVEDGVISPGGVGFDINCGVRLLRTDLTEVEVRPLLRKLVDRLYEDVPSGLGSAGAIRLTPAQGEEVMREGARWSVRHGYGVPEDLEVTEEGGCIAGADPAAVGPKPRQRGADQLGTLGSGNHFLEVQVVDDVVNPAIAKAFGISGPGQVVVMVHCGSRGFGHQVCDDYVRIMDDTMAIYGISVPDRQLACVPTLSEEGQQYLKAMRCAANFAWANRQCIAHWTRLAFEKVFGRPWQEMGMHQVYDVAHNIAKMETHQVDGKRVQLCVHRKGATRAFPAGHPDIPARYRAIGQPVTIPGDMGRASYLCVGGERSLEDTFGTTCHGAGRIESRAEAKRLLKGRDIREELAEQGIVARAGGWASLAEEASLAYKDVDEVVGVCHDAGLARKVARLRPLGVIKG